MGLVAGAYAKLSSALITDLIASQLADEHPQLFDIDHGTCKSIFLKQVRRSLGLALSHCTAGGPNSYSAAAGTSLNGPTNPVPRRPRRPIKTPRRHTPSTTTPTPVA